MRSPQHALLLALLGLALACSIGQTTPTRVPHPPASPTATPAPPTALPPTHTPPLPPPPTATPVTPDNLVTQEDFALYRLALRTVQALAQADGATLTALAAPQGVTFSPDIHLDPEDLTFSPEQLSTLWDDPTPRLWGVEAGSGRPIRLPFAVYAQRYINDRDYLHAPHIALDTRLGPGNEVDNLSQVWPYARFVEFHFPGSAQYGGMDWTSLRLVFVAEEETHTTWYLRGVFHDAWTP